MTHAILARKPAAPLSTQIKPSAATGSVATLPGEHEMALQHEAPSYAPGFSWSLSGIRLQRKCSGGGDCGCEECRSSKKDPVVQTKLTLSQPGDACEMEAERMAESMTGKHQAQTIMGVSGGVQRKAADPEGEEEGPTTKDGLSPDASGRPKREPGVAAPATVAWQRPAGQGEPLPSTTRSLMEGHFGHNFGRVRVHSDAPASVSAARLQAEAYTVGDDVYFGHGNFQPDSVEGKKLLAHELTHVVQQSGGGLARTIQREKSKKKSKCGPSDCDVKCAPGQGPVHHPDCGNETCANSGAASASNFIRHLDVNLSTQMVEAEMGDAKHATGLVGPFLSSPNPGITPTGSHTIGIKCTGCHTNMKGNGMAWFTSFKNGLEFGFHDSQTVALGVHSHGCVRVPCDLARQFHDDTESGTTTVCVHKGGKKAGSGWGCGHARPTFGGSGGGGGGGGGKSAPPGKTPESKPPATSSSKENLVS